MAAIWNGEASILRKRRIGPDAWKMILEVPSDAPVTPGQFCHLRVEPSSDPLLRRPFSYWNASRARPGVFHVTLVFTVVGRATAILSRKRPGDVVGYLGPLGNGFPRKPARTCVLVAGGVGIVPFSHLARRYGAFHPRPRLVLFFGGRTASRLYGIDEFRRLGVEVHAATEDGSRGRKGLVTDLLEERLPSLGRRGLRLYACGPDPMIEAVARIARRGRLSCLVSLERRMGCALGACGACVVRVAGRGEREWRHSRVCCEGPVYEARSLVMS